MGSNIVLHRMWRFIPFYLALIAAPLLFGGVKPESQATLGILLAIGLLLTANVQSMSLGVPKWVKVAVVVFLVLQLVPLPFPLVKILSPERARLALEFPIDGRVPAWVTLSTSPARTVQRYWELALAVAAFVLARRHATIPGAKRRLAITLSIALTLLAAADIWSGQHGRTTVLNLWTISWGKGYGAFANHNHFANWIFVASLFCIGWIVRELLRRDAKRAWPAIIFVALATTFALALAFLSASRSGMIAFAFGLALFVFLLRRRLQRRSFAIALSMVLIGTIVVGLLAAEPVLKRLRSGSTGSTLALKTEIWRRTLQIAAKFPVFGAGPGSFVRVFNHYKTTHGDGTFLHAENDFLELPFEFGFPFAILVFGIIVAAWLRSPAAESAATAGAMAALGVFLIHSAMEFVSYVPGILILAATLLGATCPAAAGEPTLLHPPSPTRVRYPMLAAGTAFLLIAVIQWAAWAFYRMAFRESPPPNSFAIEHCLTIWPFATDRAIEQLRVTSKLLEGHPRFVQTEIASRFDANASKALQLDPLNWNLRLQQTWFELAYATNTSRALSNAWLTIRLNPLQGQIPLEFARHFATNDPDLALRFVTAVDPGIPANHRSALDLAWRLTHDPAQLWKITPNTTNAILSLVHFAQEKKLYGLAADACEPLESRLPADRVARLYLDSQRPAQALRLVTTLNTVDGEAIRIEALAALGRNSEAVAAAQTFFASPTLQSLLERKLMPAGSYTDALANYERRPSDDVNATLLAEKAATLSPPNLEILSKLVAQFPSEPRIAYLLFQSQTNNPAGAAKIAAQLARQVSAE